MAFPAHGNVHLSLVHIIVMGINQSHALFAVRIRFRIAGDIGVKHHVHRVGHVVHRPLSLCAVEVVRLPPRVGVEVVNKADPVAVHEPCQVTVAFSFVFKRRGLQKGQFRVASYDIIG